jgi:site-specific recombinase XerC
VNRNVRADGPTAAARELAAFVAEVGAAPPPPTRDIREVTMDPAVEVFLTQHLRDEKGREDKTINDYRRLHELWFSPEIRRWEVRETEEQHIDRLFGRMRRAGLSRSRLNHAKSRYAPFFRRARSRKIISRDPMAGFQLPTSRYVSPTATPAAPTVADRRRRVLNLAR